jgi:hypothetical protein
VSVDDRGRRFVPAENPRLDAFPTKIHDHLVQRAYRGDIPEVAPVRLSTSSLKSNDSKNAPVEADDKVISRLERPFSDLTTKPSGRAPCWFAGSLHWPGLYPRRGEPFMEAGDQGQPSMWKMARPSAELEPWQSPFSTKGMTDMQQPEVDRGALAFWMIASLAVAILLLWLGGGIQPGGAHSIRSLPSSPVTGAMGFTFLLVWAAFAWAAAATAPHPTSERSLLGATLVLPLIVILLLRADMPVVGLVIAIAWLGVLVASGWRMARRESMAGIMTLPLVGAAIAGLLLSITLWALP